MNSHGIDYGMGTANVDNDAGIRYGVISQHSISGFALDDFEPYYGDPTCPECGNEVVDYDDEKHNKYEGSGADYSCDQCTSTYDSSECYGDEPVGFSLDDGEYQAEMHTNCDIFILKSPFYTHAQYCSPCAPGACHLDHPTDNTGPKCYCFSHEFFEGEKAPYPVYRVSDGSLVEN